MTDELQKLVAELRHPIQRNERYYEPLCARAADELERLAALAQSDAEPAIPQTLRDPDVDQQPCVDVEGYQGVWVNRRVRESSDIAGSSLSDQMYDLEQQLLNLVELARDTRSDKGGEARWTHPIGALTREFTKRIAAPPRPDAQSDAEPVAWQWRAKYTNGWSKWTEVSEEFAKCNGSQKQCEWRALYTNPPRPDASAGPAGPPPNQGSGGKRPAREVVILDASAGLIEAAEWHERKAAALREQERKADAVRDIDAAVGYDRKAFWHTRAAMALRTRAADRSGK